MFGKRWTRRNSKERKKPVQGIRCLSYSPAIPTQNFRRVFHRPQHWPRIVCVNGMGLEEKRRNDAEVAAAPTHCPKEIGILLGVCCNKAPVGENHVHSEKASGHQRRLSR